MGLCFASLAPRQTPSSSGREGTSVDGGSSSSISGNNAVFPRVETRNLKQFNFADLKAATKSFRSDVLLGEGSEINFLGRISHPNLVKLLGYCCDDVEFLLVYELMPKGSLENHLFRRNTSTETLSWNTRIKIAIGAARGLAFLHTSEKQIIYRDFKASNILLDEDYNAKISDFGLAKLGPSGGYSHVTTRIMGTYGYAAPEYVATGHLYVKSDVYGFGVVLLEILTGLRALDRNRPLEQQNLIEWAKPSLSDKKKLKSIMDERIEGQYSTKAAMRAAHLTLKCLQRDHRKRPPMKDVLETLERIEAIKNRRQ
ncbi:hypothetical protein ACSQ67_003300 [Phaseolus vulgaris]